jgi:DNA-directed RNA polymerase subunit RPC12/RpoP
MQRFKDDGREKQERRSWEDRRLAERRSSTDEVEDDRRSGKDRREGDRRVMLLDRRRRMSDPYALQHAELIREMLLHPDADVACPRCGGSLLLGPPEVRGADTAREVRCTECRHSVVISGLPPELTRDLSDEA